MLLVPVGKIVCACTVREAAQGFAFKANVSISVVHKRLCEASLRPALARCSRMTDSAGQLIPVVLYHSMIVSLSHARSATVQFDVIWSVVASVHEAPRRSMCCSIVPWTPVPFDPRCFQMPWSVGSWAINLVLLF